MLFTRNKNSGGELALRRKKFDWHEYVVYIGFVVIFIIFSIIIGDKGFLKAGNLLNIVQNTTMVIVMGVAMTFVLASGEIDLSIGSTTAFASLLCAMSLANGANTFVAIIIGLAAGLLIGVINGLCVAYARIPSFLVTLGTMLAVRGAAMWLTNTTPIPVDDEAFLGIFGTGYIGGVFPTLVIWSVAATIVGFIVLNRMRFGKKVLATGGNRTSASYTGINTKKVVLSVFMISGVCAALAGMLYTGIMHAGRYSFGDGDEMNVLAAVIIGGTSLAGGKGSVIGTVVGAVLVSMISNGLVLMGLEIAQQNILRGVIIILAVALSRTND